MSAKTESGLQAHIVRLCKARGALCYKFESPARRGVPDLLLIYEGRVIFIEVKSPAKTGTLSPLQRHEIKQLRDHGAQVYVIDSYDAATELVSSF